MIPENLLADAYKTSKQLLVIIEYEVWLRDPVAFSLVYHALVCRGHAVYFIAPFGYEGTVRDDPSLAPPGTLFCARRDEKGDPVPMRQWAGWMSLFPDIWIGNEPKQQF